MPRLLSFALTTAQFNDGTKDVTRRLGWIGLKVGEILCAVEKAQGLGKGGKVKRLGLIRVVDVRRERLDRMISDPAYGRIECGREGFPSFAPCDFVEMFCTHMKVRPQKKVTRIEFRKEPA